MPRSIRKIGRHYDLGIAYKEMGLMDDVEEFKSRCAIRSVSRFLIYRHLLCGKALAEAEISYYCHCP
jgi:hypothetical protein